VGFSFEWSGVVPLPSTINQSKVFPFTNHDTDTLIEVATMLRPEEKPLDGRFVGTVEALRGNLVSSGERAGWVELLLLISDRGWTRAIAELTMDQYREADRAHIAGSQFVSIVGTIEPRTRVWRFSVVE